jgi:peptide deformylase
MIAVDVSLARKPHHNHGLLILLNPRIIQSTGKQTGREGCLSVPDFVGLVTRHSAVLVEALDLKGETIRIETKGFEAVALQHEIDHLDGILFLDRVRSLKTDIIRRQFP